MSAAPLPSNETERLATLRGYNVLDTPPEQAFEDLTLLAAHICQVPMAMVSLVDEHRQWFKSKIGVTAQETSRDIAFCAHTILHADEMLVVHDARADPRFVDSALVTKAPNVRFYAGAPLVAPNGQALGALCVMDRSPRVLSSDQLEAMRALSRQVVAQLGLRRQAQELAGEVADRHRAEEQLRERCEELAASKHETAKLLATAEKSRHALLSVLEDEKRAGQSLRESDERFRQIAENIQEVFWITDPAKNEMVYISPAYETIWGRTSASLYQFPRNWLDAIHPDDRERIKQAAESKQSAGQYDEVYRIIRPDGSIRWVHDRAFPLRDAAGAVYRVVGTAEDITKQRKLEEQFRQAQKMEAIGTLAGGIAHDFNNILAAMNGYSELARMKVAANSPIGEYLDHVLQAGRRATDLVRQILTFSRRQEQARTALQLSDIVSESLKLLRATIPSTIEFKISLAANLPAILADATQIHQIVMNLGTNALHAMRDQPGKLEVRVENFKVDAVLAESHPKLHTGDYVRLSVADTGCGMSKDVLEHIFEPFFTTKGTGEGTGLGLAVVHGIMESHDGVITVYSQRGEGTMFHLYFPALSAPAGPGGSPAPAIIPGAGERILYVDDEEPLAKLGKRFLEQIGYRPSTTTRVEEALEWFRAEPGRFDLVITDQTMPHLTGIEFAQQLHQLRPDLPILITTGYSATLTGEKLRAAGVRELLMKPLTLEALSAALHRALPKAGPAKR